MTIHGTTANATFFFFFFSIVTTIGDEGFKPNSLHKREETISLSYKTLGLLMLPLLYTNHDMSYLTFMKKVVKFVYH